MKKVWVPNNMSSTNLRQPINSTHTFYLIHQPGITKIMSVINQITFKTIKVKIHVPQQI